MKKRVALVGLGPGNPELLTGQAREELMRCGLIIGARRALESLAEHPAPKQEAISARDIWARIQEANVPRVCVVFTGDIGLYSGAKGLSALLEGVEAALFPGISSLQYFAAKLARPWQSVRVVSGHGVACPVTAEVFTHPETFFLTDGTTTPQLICERLTGFGLGDAQVHVGENLSYPAERIVSGRADQLCGTAFQPLSVVWVENPRPFCQIPATYGLPDEEFVRGSVPMTKQVVRAAILSKLAVLREDVLWDVGAGTGSVSVEMARVASRGMVYAVEKDEEALSLIARNKAKFGVQNLVIRGGRAPGALASLPAPDGVFIGGSGGGLSGIVEMALAKNPRVRLAIAAITLETLAQAQQVFQENGIKADIVQIAVSEGRPVGRYHMMTAQNPVFVICGVKGDG